MSAQAPRQGEGFLDDYLLFLLAAASTAASAEFHAQARAAGLKVPEWRVLACLWDTDGQMVTQLAQLTLMEQSRLTRVVERLVERGLVERHGDDDDRRRVRVHLTDAGAALAGPLVRLAKSHEAWLLGELGTRDAAALKRALRKLNRVVKAPVPQD